MKHTAELAWTIIRFDVVVLFSRDGESDSRNPGRPQASEAVEVTASAISWWEFRFPELGVVPANELHVP